MTKETMLFSNTPRVKSKHQVTRKKLKETETSFKEIKRIFLE